MTEQELRDWFANQPVQPQDFVEETVALTSASEVQTQAKIKYGHELAAEEAEKIAAIWRQDFVESTRIIEAGGALGTDMWRPKMNE